MKYQYIAEAWGLVVLVVVSMVIGFALPYIWSVLKPAFRWLGA
jgi:hypothetical protein